VGGRARAVYQRPLATPRAPASARSSLRRVRSMRAGMLALANVYLWIALPLIMGVE
jgi:hypothetical protein